MIISGRYGMRMDDMAGVFYFAASLAFNRGTRATIFSYFFLRAGAFAAFAFGAGAFVVFAFAITVFLF